MMSDQSQQCAICDRPSTSRCSRCKAWSFCGRVTCQKLAWPVHRQSCRDPCPTTFTLPPLREEWVKPLSKASQATEVIYEPTGESTDWYKYVQAREWYTGTRAQLLSDLQEKPATCPITEPARTYILLAVSRPLANPRIADDNSWWSPFFLVGQDFFGAVQTAVKNGERLPDDTLAELKLFLTQCVTFNALSLDDGTIEDELEEGEMQKYRWLAIDRMTTAVRGAKVFPSVRRHLTQMVENCRMVVSFYN